MDEKKSLHSRLLDKVRDYDTPQPAKELLVANPPLTISGITASGKNSVTQYIIETTDYQQVITHTTRQPRPDEVSGQNYYFVSEEEMMSLINKEAMVEVKLIHALAIHGISVRAYQEVVTAGHRPLLVIDVQGIEEISKLLPDLRPVFLLPPSFDIWMQWLEKRGRMSHSERLRRMHSARTELEKALDNEHIFFIVNQEVPQSAREILGDVHDRASQHKARETATVLLDRLKTI